MVRRPAVFLACTVIVASALAGIACGSDSERVEPAYPTSGSSSSSSSSSGGTSSGSTEPLDSGTSSSSGGGCAPISAQVDIRTVTTAPTPTGGVIPDGTYELTDAKQQDDAADGGVIEKKGATLVFSKGTVAWHFDYDPGSGRTDVCCTGTYTLDGVTIDVQHTCNGVKGGYKEPYSVLTDGPAPQVVYFFAGGVDTYTKK